MPRSNVSSKGKTRWYPRDVLPVRKGYYECGIRISNAQKYSFLWMLKWDGVGFIVPVPMIVDKWRGRTKAAAGKA
jgi:hypothetical protein